MSRGLKKSQANLLELYQRLFEAYGAQRWWPAKTPFEVIVGAILTQNTTWTNVVRALDNLQMADLFSAKAFRMTPLDDLAALVRPSGYFNAKARKLRALGEYLAIYNDDLNALFSSKPLPELRNEILAVYGIGPETADSVLLYAGNLPTFVVDAYTVRILDRLGWLPGRGSYAEVQGLFHRSLPADAPLFNEFHALLVAHGKDVCRKRNPRCGSCPLVDLCPVGQAAPEWARTLGQGTREAIKRL